MQNKKRDSVEHSHIAPSDQTPLEMCAVHQVDTDRVSHATAALNDEQLIYQATQILSALADSTRFRILVALSVEDLCVCDLEEVCHVSQSAISHQLRLLRDRSLVKSRRDGQRAVYSLSDDHVRALIDQALAHAEHVEVGM